MASAIDRIIIAVPDLASAIAQYQCLLGVSACRRDPDVAWIGLSNTVIELQQREQPRATIAGLVIATGFAGQHEAPCSNTLGLDLRLDSGVGTAEFRRQQADCVSAELGVDHLVVRTEDASACIDVFTGKMGIRLALDKTVPEWGGRMLFFRAGKVTVEVIVAHPGGDHESVFWGLAYQCPDIEQRATLLQDRGVALSRIRPGRKPGTQVASVRSHCLEIPTLMIQPAA